MKCFIFVALALVAVADAKRFSSSSMQRQMRGKMEDTMKQFPIFDMDDDDDDSMDYDSRSGSRSASGSGSMEDYDYDSRSDSGSGEYDMRDLYDYGSRSMSKMGRGMKKMADGWMNDGGDMLKKMMKHGHSMMKKGYGSGHRRGGRSSSRYGSKQHRRGDKGCDKSRYHYGDDGMRHRNGKRMDHYHGCACCCCGGGGKGGMMGGGDKKQMLDMGSLMHKHLLMRMLMAYQQSSQECQAHIEGEFDAVQQECLGPLFAAMKNEFESIPHGKEIKRLMTNIKPTSVGSSQLKKISKRLPSFNETALAKLPLYALQQFKKTCEPMFKAFREDMSKLDCPELSELVEYVLYLPHHVMGMHAHKTFIMNLGGYGKYNEHKDKVEAEFKAGSTCRKHIETPSVAKAFADNCENFASGFLKHIKIYDDMEKDKQD